MVIVITGAPYSGKSTMVLSILRSQLDAVQVPITTTRTPDEKFDKLVYVPVSEEEFLNREENDEFVGSEQYCGDKFGVLKSDLDAIVQSGSIAIMMVEPRKARLIGQKFCEANVRAVCLYMHCSIRAMLFRMAAATKRRHTGLCSYEDVHQIYANHAIDYMNLHMDAEEDTGFDRVIPVNSDSLTGTCYPEKVIQPILGTLRNLVRAPKAKSI